MAILDLVYFGCQSNAFMTDTRTGAANIMTQPSVPGFSAMALNPGSPLIKISPRFAAGWSSFLQLYPAVPAGRSWCSIPEACAFRLATVYGHTVRLFKFAVGATGYATEWPSLYTSIMGGYLASAIGSQAYAAMPAATRRMIVTIHGENDATAAFAPSYQANIPPVIGAARAVLGAGTHVFIHRLNSAYTPGGIWTPVVQTGQAGWVTADGNATLFDQDPYPLGADNTHYTQASSQADGFGSADVITTLI